MAPLPLARPRGRAAAPCHRDAGRRVQARAAVRKQLGGLRVQRLGEGRFTVPVLVAQQDGLPFSMTLELFRGQARAPSSDLASRPGQSLFSLNYILDGTGELVQAGGRRLGVRSGDSILAPHGHTYLHAADAGPELQADGWQMASLTLLLPKQLLEAPAGQQRPLAAAAEAALQLPGEDAGVLSAEAAARIVAGACETAQAAARRQALIAARPAAASLQAAEAQLRGGGGEAGALPAREPDAAVPSHRRQPPGAVRAILDRLQRLRAGVSGGTSVLKRSLSELSAFRLPHQTNRLALVFDPFGDAVNFTFGVEIFEPGHRTTPHRHEHAHELFFILAGEGEGFCDGERFPVAAGDVVVFPPGATHGIDVSPRCKMFCLEMMQPDDMFAELVRAGVPAGALQDEDLCILTATGCG